MVVRLNGKIARLHGMLVRSADAPALDPPTINIESVTFDGDTTVEVALSGVDAGGDAIILGVVVEEAVRLPHFEEKANSAATVELTVPAGLIQEGETVVVIAFTVTTAGVASNLTYDTFATEPGEGVSNGLPAAFPFAF